MILQWIFDFSEIFDGDDRSCYQDSALSTPGMRAFVLVVQHCKFTNLSHHGPKFTWCNKKAEGLICKKLDRIMVNDRWLQTCTRVYGVFERKTFHIHKLCYLNAGVSAPGGRLREGYKYNV